MIIIRRGLSFIGTLIGFVILALMLAVILGPALYVEAAGDSAAGAVVAKRETISQLSELWSRQLSLDVRYRPSDTEEEETANVAVDTATYDQLRVGTAVRLRYLPYPPLRQIGNLAAARLDTQLPLGSFVARMGNRLPWIAGGIAAWLALLMAWSKWRSGWLALALIALMLGGVLIAGSGVPAPAPAGELIAGSATVRATERIDRVWGGRKTPAEDAVQPFVVVELEFVPHGRADPVVAVDLIDDGSATLDRESAVAIHYSAANPRWAQIDGATRTYWWKNLRTFGIIALVIAALLVWGRIASRRRRTQATP